MHIIIIFLNWQKYSVPQASPLKVVEDITYRYPTYLKIQQKNYQSITHLSQSLSPVLIPSSPSDLFDMS